MKVPFVDLKPQYQAIKSEIDLAISGVLENTSFIGGPIVKDFENNFANYLGVQNCIGCGNGTDALEIVLQAMGIGAGDEVIVPAMSWISTSETVSSLGATPVFADVLPEKFTIDPEDFKRKITSKTKAIIPVHLYGKAAEMDQLFEIACEHNLKLIEDSAQAIGAQFNGRNIATFGDAATFSFYPGKNLGAYGDAGCIVSNNDELAAKCRVIANHGQTSKHNHVMEGRNSRLDTMQAAILDVKLKHIETWTEKRINIAKQYNELLVGLPIGIPPFDENHRHVYHVYVINVVNRDAVKAKLTEVGISTQIHYPKALTSLAPYSSTNKEIDFPIATNLGNTGLSLPMYPELDREQIEYVVERLKAIV
jgi:dTDP-4-amino-4,6-dideoxygalactose transaminase